MIVFVVGEIIEQHTAIHLLHIFTVLSQVAGKGKKI